jgi:anti-anti-sigma factor
MEPIAHEDRGGTCWIHLRGDLDQSEVLKMKAEFDRIVESSKGDVVLEMSGVTFLGTLGIGLFLAAHQRLLKVGRKVKLSAVPPAIEDTLDLMNISELLERV